MTAITGRKIKPIQSRIKLPEEEARLSRVNGLEPLSTLLRLLRLIAAKPVSMAAKMRKTRKGEGLCAPYGKSELETDGCL